MIVGIGCDIVEHSITTTLGWSSKPRKIERVFSKDELALCVGLDITKFLSGRFAAKEAVLKSIGVGIEDGISLNEIEILSDNNGRPFVKVGGTARLISNTLKISNWHVSISHSETSSIAFVVAEAVPCPFLF